MDDAALFPDGLIRLVAPNPSPMTYSGTCTYLLGKSEIAVIDPGPDDAAHLAAILDAVPTGGRITHILVTHAHIDHCSLAHRLAEKTGAPVLAAYPPDWPVSGEGGEGIVPSFRPDTGLREGDTVKSADWQLDVVATPGHLLDHISFVWEAGDAVFTGDHVMGWASTFISPPEGSVSDYMASLDRLAALPQRRYFPGHGPAIAEGPDRARALKAHRQEREAQILAALKDGPASIPELTQTLYHDVPKQLHAAAARNVAAHLADLQTRGVVATLGQAGEVPRYRV